MAGGLNALKISHQFLEQHLKSGNLCIDATVGRGKDTSFLCSLVGESGKVVGFDIQQEALDSATLWLQEHHQSAELILDSHSNMEHYFQPESVDGIVFNFGWLPGGNHKIFTTPKTSIPAIESGLRLLKKGGVMSLCLYYGRDCGYEEKNTLLDFFSTIDSSRYTVLVVSFTNRPNDPPIPVLITRDE